MGISAQASPRPEAQQLHTELDSDSTSAPYIEGTRKRPRAGNDEPNTAACDHCRLRKVRCDRGQPECSNCRKAGVECSSSNPLKRVNQTKQLRDDFSIVLKRLGDVEKTLGTLTELTRQIATRPCPHSIHLHAACPPNHNAVPLLSPRSLELSESNIQSDSPHSTEFAENKSLFEKVEFDQGGERLYNDPAPVVLIKSLLRQATAPLRESARIGERHGDEESYISRALRDPTTRITLQHKMNEFPFKTPCREFVVASDMNPVTTPPRLMVNLFVDGYLENINSRMPIFDPASLHRAIDTHYSEEKPLESTAWALILNNIVLLELSLEIQAARASRSNSYGTNDDILPSFLKNCDRAIGHLDAFMMPSLVNIQALMTLTLAAREFYNNGTAEKVCHVACQVGRAWGLHRSKTRRQGEENIDCCDSEKERGRLFRVLYTLDKQRVFMTGQPCDLYMFDSDHHISTDSSRDRTEHSISDAFNHLMTIWEEIYLKLYTLREAGANGERRASQMRLVMSSMDNFAQLHSKTLSSSSTDVMEDFQPLQMEISYGYLVSQVLILRCDQGSNQSQDKMREISRSCLRLILDVCKTRFTATRIAVLGSLFRNYPIVAFVELVAFHMANLFKNGEYDTAMQADISLVRATCNQLQILQYEQLENMFYVRLRLGLSWALDTLEILGKFLAKPSPIGSSPHDRNGCLSTESSQDPTIAQNFSISDISGSCTLCPNAEDFTHNRLVDFDLFNPDLDTVSSTCQFDKSTSTCQHRSGLAPGGTEGISDWGDVNLNFF
ncbi:hypothetical protein F4775DRAFT_535138 [Biscogniauxia sp. FL1348]|nr:hypothetical protein F4775DRAFT_535138 [Biscogniauxia sp. FL1348]